MHKYIHRVNKQPAPTDILTVNFINEKYGIFFRIVAKKRGNNMHKTIHFSRYCWSGYLPKGGTKEGKKTSHIECCSCSFKIFTLTHSYTYSGSSVCAYVWVSRVWSIDKWESNQKLLGDVEVACMRARHCQCVSECDGNVTIPLVTLSSSCLFPSNMFCVVFPFSIYLKHWALRQRKSKRSKPNTFLWSLCIYTYLPYIHHIELDGTMDFWALYCLFMKYQHTISNTNTWTHMHNDRKRTKRVWARIYLVSFERMLEIMHVIYFGCKVCVSIRVFY